LVQAVRAFTSFSLWAISEAIDAGKLKANSRLVSNSVVIHRAEAPVKSHYR
jgi:hypothetical protein